MKKENPFYAKINTNNQLDWGKLHDFNFEFCTRYAKQLSEGKDMRFVFDYELSCYETGLNCFYLGLTYRNFDGEEMVVIDRREDLLIIEYQNEYYAIDYWNEGNFEYCIMGNIEWQANIKYSVEDIKTNK